MNNITKEEWAEIGEKLASLYNSVYFKLGEHKISVVTKPINETKISVVVYVDSEIKGSWFGQPTDDTPTFVSKVYPKRTISKYSAKAIKSIEKHWGKRAVKRDYPDLHDKIEYHTPYFSKASVLVRHYKKIEGLEYIKECSNE